MAGVIETVETVLRGMESGRAVRVGWFTPKHQYLLPVWDCLVDCFHPVISRKNESKHLIEVIGGSQVECWCLDTNPNAGRGRDYDLVVVDEAGLINRLKYWLQSSIEPTMLMRSGRILVLGTPNLSADFDRLYEDASAGLISGWCALRAPTFDNPLLPESELRQIEERRNEWPSWLWRREYLAIPADTASGFFARSLIDEHRRRHASAPACRGQIIFLAETDNARRVGISQRRRDLVKWSDDPSGSWRLWMLPDEIESLISDVHARASWCMGVDLGAGVGASNSVVSVGDAFTGRKVAEYASSGVTPERMALMVASAGIWFGGSENPAMVLWEVNGPGEVFGREILRLGYPSLCRALSNPADVYPYEWNSEFGWRSSNQSKETLLSEYRSALATGRFVNPSEAALSECLTYCYGRNGRLISVRGHDDPESMAESARIPHGDRVIADALCWEAMRQVAPVAPPSPEPVRDGIWSRIMDREREMRMKRRLVY